MEPRSQISKLAARLARYRGADDGFTIVELLVAVMVLVVGVLTTFAVFGVSKRAARVSELHESETHLAQKEIQRLQAMPYAQVGMKSAPGTSTNVNSPNYYVSPTPSAACPSFRWNQSSGTLNNTAPLAVQGCGDPGDSSYSVPTSTTTTANGITYTISDFVTWVNNDSVCNPGTGCPVSNAYKRASVEVTNNQTSGAPVSPVLVSTVLADPHAQPVVGNPNVTNPLNNPAFTCTDGSGHTVSCDFGLGGQTPNVWYPTDTPWPNSYTPPGGDNPCMHYTVQQVPLLGAVFQCGGSSPGPCTLLLGLTGCPVPDLLNNGPPPGPPPQQCSDDCNWSPNIPQPPGNPPGGRVIEPDPNATGCGATPSNDARYGVFFATKALGSQLNLSGNGGMTLYTNTWHGLTASVTICVAVYIESPVLGAVGQVLNMLDPLNLVHVGDSVRLGVTSFTMASWPAVVTPISFTFNNLFAAQAAAAGNSIGVRIWVAASSGDGIVVHYDGVQSKSSVQINSQ